MQEQLPTELVQLCERSALGQALTDWQSLSYDEVLDILRSPENELWVNDERILVWLPFEDVSGDFLADHIESLFKSFIRVARSAIETR